MTWHPELEEADEEAFPEPPGPEPAPIRWRQARYIVERKEKHFRLKGTRHRWRTANRPDRMGRIVARWLKRLAPEYVRVGFPRLDLSDHRVLYMNDELDLQISCRFIRRPPGWTQEQFPVEDHIWEVVIPEAIEEEPIAE